MASLNELKIKITVLTDQLKAELNQVKSELNKLKQAGNDKNQGAGLKQVNQEAKGLKGNIDAAKTSLISFLGVGFSAFLAKQLLDVSEKWLQLTNTVKQSTKSTEEYSAAMSAVESISRKTYTSLDANANLFAKINRALSDMGGTSQQSIFLTEMIAKLAGMETNAAGAAAGVYQLTQAIASGKFAGDEFRSVSEQLPIFAQTLAKGLGVSLGQLREMSRDGQLGTAEIMKGLSSQAEEVDKIFKSMPLTFSKAMQNMENAWIKFIGQFNEANGISQTLGTAINGVADNLETIATIGLKAFGVVIVGGVVKLTASLYEYAKAQSLAALETRANAVSQAQAAQAEAARVAELRAKVATQEADTLATIASTRVTIANTEAEIASLRASLALTQSLAARQVLTGMLTRAEEQLVIANTQLAESQFALNAIQTQGAVTTSALTKAMTALNAAMAAWAGWELGSWARETFVWVEKLGIVYAALIGLLINPVEFAKNPKAYYDAWKDQLDAVGDESIKATQERQEAEAKAAKEREQQQQAEIKQFEDGIAKNLEKFKRTTDAKKSEYDRDLRNIEQTEQAKLRAIETATPLKLDKEKTYQQQKDAIVQAGMMSELAKLNNRDAVELAANQARLRSFQDFYGSQLLETTRIYDAEIATAKARNLSTAQLERDAADAKKKILLAYEQSYEQSINQLNAKEQEHRNKAIGYLNEIEQREQSREEKLRQIEEIGKTQVEASEMRKQQLIKGTQQVKDLIAAGELTKAKELSDKLEQIAFDRIEKTKQAEAKAAELNKNLPQQRGGLFGDEQQIQQYTSLIGSSSEALRQYNEIAKLGDSALKGLADTQTKQADDAKAQADKQVEALTNVRNMIADIDNAIKTSNTLKINVDDSAARAAIEELKKPTESTHTIRFRQDGSTTKGYADGGLISGAGTGTSDSIVARVSNGEYVIPARATESVGVSSLDYIRQYGKLPKFADGGLVGGHKPAYQPSLSSSQAQKSGDTFVLQIPFNNTVGTFTGVKTAQNTDFLKQIADAMTQQSRGMV